MIKTEFISFVFKTFDEVLLCAELYTKKTGLKEISFKWMRKDSQVFTSREEIVEEIVSKVYVSEDQIYPCVDLHVLDVVDNRITVHGRIANFAPKPFGKGWSNRPGPFIYCVNQKIIHPTIDPTSKLFLLVLKEHGLMHYD